MPIRSQGYPVVSQTTLVEFMARFLATAEGQMTAEQFAAAGIQSYFIQNPIEDDIASSVAAYLAANPPTDGQNATAAQVQQAVDAYYAANPDSVVTNAELAAAIAAYLRANPPQPGATGPAGQNATAEQVAAAVAAYMSANPLGAMVGAYIAANASMFKGDPGDTRLKDVKSGLVTNSSGVWTKTYPANFWIGTTATTGPSVNVQPVMASGTGAITSTVVKSYNATTKQWTVTVSFSRINPTLSVLVLGVLNVVVNPGAVTFDYQAAEPNA